MRLLSQHPVLHRLVLRRQVVHRLVLRRVVALRVAFLRRAVVVARVVDVAHSRVLRQHALIPARLQVHLTPRPPAN